MPEVSRLRKSKEMKYDFDVPRSELEKTIDEWVIGRHAERNRKVLKRKLIDGLTFEEVAEEFDLSVRHTKNIVYKSEEKLFKHIEGRQKNVR